MEKETIVINLFAGPGTGKSTTAAGIFYHLKCQGINCELVTEYAKSKVWEDSHKVLHDQIYIFGKQNHKMEILRGKVKVIVTDSPLLLSLLYGTTSTKFKDLVKEQFDTFDNWNYFLKRVKKYNTAGRSQTLEEAKELDSELMRILYENNVKFSTIDGDTEAATIISDAVIAYISEKDVAQN